MARRLCPGSIHVPGLVSGRPYRPETDGRAATAATALTPVVLEMEWNEKVAAGKATGRGGSGAWGVRARCGCEDPFPRVPPRVLRRVRFGAASGKAGRSLPLVRPPGEPFPRGPF